MTCSVYQWNVAAWEQNLPVSRTLCASCGCIKRCLCLMKRIIPKIGKTQPCSSIRIKPQLWLSGRTITDFNSMIHEQLCLTRMWHYSHCRTCSSPASSLTWWQSWVHAFSEHCCGCSCCFWLPWLNKRCSYWKAAVRVWLSIENFPTFMRPWKSRSYFNRIKKS